MNGRGRATPGSPGMWRRSARFARTLMGAAGCVCVLAGLSRAGVVERIRALYGADTTIAAEFDLTVYWSAREKYETMSGRMRIAPAERFRVELGPTTWVCDGRTVWQYSSRTNQVVIMRLSDLDISTHPSRILATYVRGYDYRVLQETGRQATLRWEADSADRTSFYRQITITFDKSKGVVQSLEITDRNGNRSTYRFKRSRFGEPMPPGTFEFVIPKGADVHDERR